MRQLIECVPNFSEGLNLAIINQITAVISATEGITLLDVDPGAATNRTVVTFVGEPAAVVEAAFKAIQMAKQLIDMRGHTGQHPRFGATDVCPLIPVANITMAETADWARQLAERVGKELQYPVYLYESAASKPDRKNLATVRSGEYEGLAAKLQDANWKPDFGPATFVPQTGATAIGARDFLVAVNFNLNTTSTRRANAVAFDIREAGRMVQQQQADGTMAEVRQPGLLKACKGIGWYIPEYGVAQVSVNLTDIGVTSLHTAFDAVTDSAHARGMRVTGAEIVGLLPLKVLTDAGRHYLRKQQRSVGVPDHELIKIAIKSMGLEDLKPFDAATRVIEYCIEDKSKSSLLTLTARGLVEETASESPAPGGGSVAAYVGALGVALGTMVANLSSHKKGYDDRWAYFSDFAEQGFKIQTQLLALTDADTHAFNSIMDAFGLPKATPEDKQARTNAIQAATRHAIAIPLQVMEVALSAFPLLEAMIDKGNPNSVTDAGVGALCCRTAVLGAYLNVKVNATGYKADANWLSSTLAHADAMVVQANADADRLYQKVIAAL